MQTVLVYITKIDRICLVDHHLNGIRIKWEISIGKMIVSNFLMLVTWASSVCVLHKLNMVCVCSAWAILMGKVNKSHTKKWLMLLYYQFCVWLNVVVVVVGKMLLQTANSFGITTNFVYVGILRAKMFRSSSNWLLWQCRYIVPCYSRLYNSWTFFSFTYFIHTSLIRTYSL